MLEDMTSSHRPSSSGQSNRPVLILASASPRRHELLRSAGLAFTVEVADVDEAEHPDEDATRYVERVALAKAEAIAGRRGTLDGCVVLAADTTVDVDGAILAKPVDDDDARRMLRLLSGRTHLVHTAVVCRHAGGVEAVMVTTGVTFAPLTDDDIDWYLALGEHLDKAGAYGMQGAAGGFVERIDGSPTNVIGLPLAQTVHLLRSAGAI
jgi:septum formation protein